jgi:hypothetical protein
VRQTASWLALLATSTLGAQSSTLLAQVRLTDARRRARNESPHRLIVQIYQGSPEDLSPSCRPSSSAQRAVTIDELRKGVAVQLVDVSNDQLRDPNEPLTVIAWVEQGPADLEFDALNARPRQDGPIGSATVLRDAGSVSVELSGHAAAA